MYKLAKQFVVPNDKITKTVFSLNSEEFSRLINGGKICTISERKKGKKNNGRAVQTIITLKIAGNITAEVVKICSAPFDAFDRAVFSAAVSELVAGNNTTSISAIYRLMHGKAAGGNYRLKDKQAQEILHSLNKLSALRIVANLDEICKNFRYNGGNPFSVDKPILPCRIYEGKFLGKHTTLIEFTDESPLLTIAKLKNNQLLTFDSKLLTEANRRFNRRTMAVKFYTLIRVCEIKLHNLTPIITVADIFEKCRINVDIRHERKAHCLDAIVFLLELLKSENFIENYTLKKDTQKDTLFPVFELKFSKNIGNIETSTSTLMVVN